MRRRCTAGPIALLLVVPLGDSLPNEGPLRVKLMPLVQQARSQAPMMFDVHLTWDRPELLEGKLEFTFYDGQRKLGWFRTHDLALTAGTREFRATVPSMEMGKAVSSFSVAVKFYTSKGQIVDLSDHDLLYPPHWRRAFVIAVSSDRRDALAPVTEMAQSLRLEKYQPRQPTNIAAAVDGHLSTYPVHLPPGDFPVNALAYCAFDIVILTAEGLPSLETEQLNALADWVRAGGSLCIDVSGTLEEKHVAFLNRLLEPGMTPFLSDERSHVVGGPLDGGRVLQKCRSGLGRTLLLRQVPEGKELVSARWRDALAFVWKLRKTERHALLRRGRWDFDAVESQKQRSASMMDPQVIFGAPEFGLYAPFDPHYEQVAQFLIPGSVEGVPLSMVVSVLVGFLLTVGPVDYFVLGHFRLRRYTWIFFFVASVGFTWFMVHLSNLSLGQTDFRGTLVLADYGDDNRVVRQSEIELLFTATQRPVRAELRNTLFAPLPLEGRRDPSDPTVDDYSSRHFSEFAGNYVGDPPLVEGSMPGVFAAEYAMQKWSPRLSRYTVFQADDQQGVSLLDFSGIDPADLGTPQGRGTVARDIQRRHPDAEVLLYRGREVIALTNQSDPAGGKLRELIQWYSVPPAHGVFGVVAQVSPTGSHFLEDLPLLDGSDPLQCLLVVVLREGDNWIVHRRLYHDVAVPQQPQASAGAQSWRESARVPQTRAVAGAVP